MIRRRRFRTKELAEVWADGLEFVNDSSIKDIEVAESTEVPGKFVVTFVDSDYDEPNEEEYDYDFIS